MNLTITYDTVTPGCCGGVFAVPADVHRRWKETHADWWCPFCGGCRVYRGSTEEEKKIRQLEAQVQQQAERALKAEVQAETLKRQKNRIVGRIKNGVCPCCDRTFQNVLQHMKTKHPELGAEQKLRAVRKLYGLTQSEAASEIGVSLSIVSQFEREIKIGDWSERKIKKWLKEKAS